MGKFTTDNIESQAGKTVLITGGNSGIGYQTALVLASKGAKVIITARNAENGEQAVGRIKAQVPNAKVSYELLDLASLASIKAFVNRFAPAKLDILINNAGVMFIPQRTLTQDGFEMQFGTNHLGHFALTLGLLPLLRKAEAPRIVALSSSAAYNGTIDFDNLQGEKKYSSQSAYSQSKLANLLFMNELGKREKEITCVAAHPGFASTNLQRNASKTLQIAMNVVMKFAGQPIEDAALPTLYAATQPDVKSGMFFGPTGRFNKGSAGQVKMPERAGHLGLAKQLWDVSEQLTGVRYNE
jgi:NAD(P)-dependent dehydrogenase (short-subunit alcohol dehydrogenase family)